MNELHLVPWWTILFEHPTRGMIAKPIHCRAHDVEATIRALSQEHQILEVKVRASLAEEIGQELHRIRGKG